MKNIRMCDDEIENYFNENGKLNIKVKWEKENKGFVLTLRWLLVILFWFIPLFGWLFEKLSEFFSLIDNGLTTIEYSIERAYFKRKYIKDYLIPTKKEIKEYYKRNYEE